MDMLPSFRCCSVAAFKVLLFSIIISVSGSPKQSLSPITSTSDASTAVDVIFEQNNLIIRPRGPNPQRLPRSIRCANLQRKFENKDEVLMRDAYSGALRHGGVEPSPDVLITAPANDADDDAVQCTVHKQKNYVRALVQLAKRSYELRSSSSDAEDFSLVRIDASEDGGRLDAKRGAREDGARLSARPFLRDGAAARRLQKSAGYSGRNGYYPLTCWQTYAHTLKIGVAVDAGFYVTVGNNDNSVRNYVLFLLELASKPFVNQLNIHLELSELILPPQGIERQMNHIDDTGNYTIISAPIDDNGNCENPPLELRTRAHAFNSWRMKYHQKRHGVWHLLTVCNDYAGEPTGGSFGTSGTKGVCSFNKSYAAVRAYVIENTNTDVTFFFVAHELGHILGAKHPWETDGCKLPDGSACTAQKAQKAREAGLMGADPTNVVSKWNGLIQFHPIHANDLCATIETTIVRNEENETTFNDSDDVYDKDLCWSVSATPTVTTAPASSVSGPTMTTTTSKGDSLSASLGMADLDADTRLIVFVGGGVVLVLWLMTCFGIWYASVNRHSKSENLRRGAGSVLSTHATDDNSPSSQSENGGTPTFALKGAGKGASLPDKSPPSPSSRKRTGGAAKGAGKGVEKGAGKGAAKGAAKGVAKGSRKGAAVGMPTAPRRRASGTSGASKPRSS